ncbi:MAG: sigma-70 family RNA polymerase sigma factor [Chthonomonadales bacterium]
MANADTILIERCQANDAAAFNEIVARYKSRVHNYVARMVGPNSDAEDLTQEVFIRAYVNMHSFQSRASLNTWLYRIATNICIDFARKTKRVKANTTTLMREDEESGEEIERDIPDSKFEPQSVLMNRELGDKLEQALELLPEKLRTVVLLHDIEGLAYDEIAHIIECPLGTVKSRLFNARAALRERLIPYLDGSSAPVRLSR